MRKLETLRAALEDALPELAASPEQLVVQALKGQMVGTGAASDSFEYRYTAQVLVMDFDGHPDAVVVPVMRWVREHQPELLYNPTFREGNNIRFEAEVLSNRACDLLVEVEVTERVVVTGTAESWTAEHVAEPPEDPAAPVVGRGWVLVWPPGTEP